MVGKGLTETEFIMLKFCSFGFCGKVRKEVFGGFYLVGYSTYRTYQNYNFKVRGSVGCSSSMAVFKNEYRVPDK